MGRLHNRTRHTPARRGGSRSDKSRMRAQFTKETGFDVEYITYEDPDEVEARLASEPGKFDVVIADDLSINRLSELRLIQPIDDKLLQNLSNISDEYVGKKFDPANDYSLPYMWGTTLVAYRSDKIEQPEKTWKSLLFIENALSWVAARRDFSAPKCRWAPPPSS